MEMEVEEGYTPNPLFGVQVLSALEGRGILLTENSFDSGVSGSAEEVCSPNPPEGKDAERKEAPLLLMCSGAGLPGPFTLF